MNCKVLFRCHLWKALFNMESALPCINVEGHLWLERSEVEKLANVSFVPKLPQFARKLVRLLMNGKTWALQILGNKQFLRV